MIRYNTEKQEEMIKETKDIIRDITSYTTNTKEEVR